MENTSVTLEEMIPRTATVEIEGKEYTLRKFSLSDQAWAIEKFGGAEGIQAVFDKPDLKGICQMVFHQLSDKDKRDFMLKHINLINDDGEEEEVRLTAVDQLMRKVSGSQHATEMVIALMKTIGVSQPLLDKVEAEGKKKSKKQTRRKK